MHFIPLNDDKFEGIFTWWG